MNTNRRRLLASTLLFAACQPLAQTPTGSPVGGGTATSEPRPTSPGTAIVGGPFVAPVEACAGAREWTGVPSLVIRLADAWHEPDYRRRLAILESIWNDDTVYQDPYGDTAIGLDALAGVMGYGVTPAQGQYLELRSSDASDMHHGAIRMAWRHCCPSGFSILEGTDILSIGPDGKVTEDVSFWERYVEEPAEDACTGPRLTSAPATAPSDDAGTASCSGPDVDWSSMPPVAQGYGKAWNERDATKRRAILDEVWAIDGTYADPTVSTPIAGRQAFADHLGEFFEAGFGEYFEPRAMAEGDFHHQRIRMPWTYCDANDQVVWVGEDIAWLDGEGRITRDLGFFIF